MGKRSGIGVAVLWLAGMAGAQAASGPAFDCRRAGSGTVVKLVCGDEALAARDRQMASVYAQALQQAQQQGFGAAPLFFAFIKCDVHHDAALSGSLKSTTILSKSSCVCAAAILSAMPWRKPAA